MQCLSYVQNQKETIEPQDNVSKCSVLIVNFLIRKSSCNFSQFALSFRSKKTIEFQNNVFNLHLYF